MIHGENLALALLIWWGNYVHYKEEWSILAKHLIETGRLTYVWIFVRKLLSSILPILNRTKTCGPCNIRNKIDIDDLHSLINYLYKLMPFILFYLQLMPSVTNEFLRNGENYIFIFYLTI
jgi:hypothetical protein